MEDNHLDTLPKGAHESQDESINISDVIEVIETDPDFKESPKMFNGGQEVPQSSQRQPQQLRHAAYVRIIEQPASKALRFRYECEGRSAGSIPGASSTPENKTYPSIQVVGYKGRAVVVVSCVTKDQYKPHPHKLVGRDMGCKRGVCTVEINPETMSVTFTNLGIQCVKKKDIESALKEREEIRVDPFRTGFSHRNQPTSIDLNTVRLCFQVFLEKDQPNKFTLPLAPVVSEPIYDKKAMSDLNIIKLSDCVSHVDGGRKDIILLCEKVAREDIQIRFYEERNNQVVWEGVADFQPSQVHKQHAIWFRTPAYSDLSVTEPVNVFIQLRRPSDGATSESLPFQLLPLDAEPGALKRKRQKIDDNVMSHLRKHDNSNFNYATLKTEGVKTEPFGGLSPMYAASCSGLSPQPFLPIEVLPLSPQDLLLNQVQYQQQNWNILSHEPSTSQQVPTNKDLNSLNILNLDSQEINQLAIDIFPNGDELPEIHNLSLSEINMTSQDQNMSDSLTRLANNALDNIYNNE